MIGRLFRQPLRKTPLEPLQQGEPAEMPRRLDLRRRIGGILRRIAKLEGIPLHPEQAGARVAAAPPADADDGRQIAGVARPLGGQLAGDDRAERGVAGGGIGQIPGVHQIAGPRMASLLARHGTDDGEPVGHLRGLGPVLGELDARDARGDRLGVAAVLVAHERAEGLELRRAALHPEEDAGLAALAEVGRVGRGDGAPAEGAERNARRHGPQDIATGHLLLSHGQFLWTNSAELIRAQKMSSKPSARSPVERTWSRQVATSSGVGCRASVRR